MLNNQSEQDEKKEATTGNGKVLAPSISLPKGGGAIRGIGEKFAANPVTGTGSMSLPIATSPGRADFGAQLALSYDSGTGNGPFGLGWSLSLPAITRKTDKGLPRYDEATESDVFILSGAEDLVPALRPDSTRFKDDTTASGYVIHRYRPRIEGLFARIERWTNVATGEIHWRSISRDNVTTLYGMDDACRIYDPADPSPANPTRIFSWLICQRYDDKGNAIVYEYAAENDDNVDRSLANERNRVRTANRYLKRIKYGNRVSRLIQPDLTQASWMFEVVFDYDEAHYEEIDLDPATPKAEKHEYVLASPLSGSGWAIRPDPFSSHRAGFEVRTYRRCRRILMFHHIPDLPSGEKGYDGLVRSTEFDYADLDYSQPVAIEDELAYQGSTRFASFIRAVIQSGYVRDDSQAVVVRDGVEYATYLKKSLPPLEFEYSKAAIQDQVFELDAASLENLPAGLDGSTYQWVDLHGEGAPGILTEQAGAWFYKRNLSPLPVRGSGSESVKARLAPVELVAVKPNLALANGQAQFMDLAGDGQTDVVVLDGPVPGLYEHDSEEGWQPFRPFTSRLSSDTRDPNLRFVDLDGDGHADVLITEDDAFVWHPSQAEEGFGPAERVARALDEEEGPRLVFADGTQSIYLADMCGDGLTDLVRVRNGEVCYWPNLGYGHFGAKVTMDNAPWFDTPDQFDQRRVRLADIDGSGTNDIIYLHHDGVRLYFNQSGNRLSEARHLAALPHVDNVSSVMTADLLGNGTACLVWSSPLPTNARQNLRYIDLMGGTKPHLLIKSLNNLGAETQVHYAPSTRFYLADKRDGRPWVSRLPFPVHVIERVITHDRISGNVFVTRYAYHHGYFDGVEREFRGFGMVEQWDTEEFAALNADGQAPAGTNVEASSHVPPVLTKTWFHTGVYLGRGHVSDFFAGLLDANDVGEYYREPGLTDAQARALLLEDTVLPEGLTVDEEREACRALKGSMLRQEVYALDDTDKQPHPYTVTEQDFTIRMLQPREGNGQGVFFTHARESISYQYERVLVPVLNGQIVDEATADTSPGLQWLPDPRVVHTLTLEVDRFGNVLRSATIGYGRRYSDLCLPSQTDCDKQTEILITYSENRFTKSHDTGAEAIDAADDYRAPLPCESRTYELTGLTLPAGRNRFTFEEVLNAETTAIALDYENGPTEGLVQKRLIEHVRTYYRRNNLVGPLPLGELQSLALPFESYKLAFTPGLVAGVFGGRASDAMLENEGRFIHTEGDSNWWIPSGQVFYSPDTADTPPQELAYARQHFFLPHRYRDPFHTNAVSAESFVTYDNYDLLVHETLDALGNQVTVGERQRILTDGTVLPEKRRNDYRVLQPALVMDPNRNCLEVAFDALGMVVGTAVMGKPEEKNPRPGDVLNYLFQRDLTQAQTEKFMEKPREASTSPHESMATQFVHDLLGTATTRIVYDLDRYKRLAYPPFAATIARETHVSELQPNQSSKLRVSFSYSDGFGREIQKKIQAEPGPVPQRGADGKVIVGADGQPQMMPHDAGPRWVGSGWTVFNNKGKPVCQYEPFFTDTHRFEFDVKIGVSPVLFYDPVERIVATLLPNHTWEKVVFDPWQQKIYDANDTVAFDPRTDTDVAGYVSDYFEQIAPQPSDWETWLQQRGVDPPAPPPDSPGLEAEKKAAVRTLTHADTPTVACFDTLGRPFLTIAHNKFTRGKPDGTVETFEERYPTRVDLDIEGNQRSVRDAKVQNGDTLGRIVMRYDYDMLGNRIHQASMEAGERWMLNDVAGNPIRAWDSRGHTFHTAYDRLRRPLRSFVTGADPADPNQVFLTERVVYGEQHPEAEQRNLRGALYLHLDQAGAVTTEAIDFKGNLLRASRRIADEYKQALNWSMVDAALPASAMAPLDPAILEAVLSPLLEDDTYESSTTYDALNRPIQLIAPHSDQAGTIVNVIQPIYNEANLLEQEYAWLGRNAEPEGWLDPATATLHAVTNIDYNAKGQRERIAYANGALTTYDYDPLTFRLIRLKTTRPADSMASQLFKNATVVQDLRYTYDPIGNITRIEDVALKTIFHNSQQVEPVCSYTYDAIYRLIEAQGREHIGQTAHDFNPQDGNYRDYPFVGHLAHPNDAEAMRNYTERYQYDAVGNFEILRHLASSGSWTRRYEYEEDSLIEAGKKSNRLTRTMVGNGLSNTETYTYDAHGNMTSMPHLPLMQWDFEDQLQATGRQVVANGGMPETTYYVYDASGQRVRKVTKRQNGTRKEERIYLGGFEIYRAYNGSGSTVELERETLHVMDDTRRIALVETRTQGDGDSPKQLIRYQFDNHLGSSSVELDDQAQIISYEEYYPYGSTSYQAGRSQTEVEQKRYRYSGKERDEETGFNYHRARYYAPWLGRWTSFDPIGMKGGIDAYVYVNDNPVRLTDLNGTQDHPADEKNEPSTWETVKLMARVQFVMTTGQTPEEFGKGMLDKAKALTVEPIMTVYGPGGMIDKAAQKLVDKIQGNPDREYVTEEEHAKHLQAIIAVGGMLYPGVELPVKPARLRPAMARTGAVTLSRTTEVVPEAAAEARGVMMSKAEETAKPLPKVKRIPEGVSGTKPPTPTRVRPSTITAKPKGGTATTRYNASALADVGMNLRQAFKTFDEEHHLFVQQYRKWFSEKKINIDEYTVTLTWGEHSAVHSTGWNTTWTKWISENRGASREVILNKMNEMRKQFGLEGNPIHPYKR